MSEAQFYLIVPPGLEKLAARELDYWLDKFDLLEKPTLAYHKGGLEMTLPVQLGYALNSALKIPTRILQRVGEFRCRDFPTLYRQVKRENWRLFVEGGDIDWRITARGSRLNNERRILQTCEQAMADYNRAFQPRQEANKMNLSIFVRLFDDQCTLSVDTSGEALYLRGYKPFVGPAPLRENLAAAVIWALVEDLHPSAVNNFCFFDPMTGAGTFLLEAYHIFRLNRSRDYRFQYFAKAAATASTEPKESLSFAEFLGCDISEPALKAARQNTELAKMSATVCEIKNENFWQLSLPKNKIYFAACNPPYGERLRIEGEISDYFSRILSRFQQLESCARVAVIVPKRHKTPQLAAHFKLQQRLSFLNGGLPVELLVFANNSL